MKTTTKNLFLAIAFVLATALTSMLVSCKNESGVHLSRFIYPASTSNPYYLGYMPLYADQPSDSIFFATTENWQLRTDYYGGGDGWLIIPEDLKSTTFKMEPNTIYYMAGPIVLQPNTTGRKRRVIITLDAGDYDCNAGFIQLPYLSISRPYRYVITTTTQTSLDSRDSLATLFARATTEQDSICFTVHAAWTLKAKDGTWLTLEKSQGDAGSQAVRFTLQQNTTSTSRSDTLLLSTYGVGNATDQAIVDTITVTQLAME